MIEKYHLNDLKIFCYRAKICQPLLQLYNQQWHWLDYNKKRQYPFNFYSIAIEIIIVSISLSFQNCQLLFLFVSWNKKNLEKLMLKDI